jgi:hypothetical protein
MPSHQHYHHQSALRNNGNDGSFLGDLWDSFWNPPHIACPKCGSEIVEYYDPFFFSPVRTLKNRRRVKCTTCHFIWRPSRRKKTFWKGIRPFF